MAGDELATLTDGELVERLQSRADLEAFDELLKRYHKPVFYFCLRTLADNHTAEEITQDVMYKVYRKINKLKNQERLKTWIYRIASNACKDYYRSLKKEYLVEPDTMSRLPDHRLGPGEVAELKERSRHVRDAVAKLPPMQRQAIILFHFQHLSYREIAEILQCPLGTVMSRICYGKRQLKSLLKEYLGLDPKSAVKGGACCYAL